MPATNRLNHNTVHAWSHPRFTRLDIEMEAAPSGAQTQDATSWNITVWALMFVVYVSVWDNLSEDKQVTEEIAYFCVAMLGDCIHLRKLTIHQVATHFLHETAENESLSITCREREIQKGHRLCSNECWFSNCRSRSRMFRRIASYVNMTTHCAACQCMFSYCTRNFDQSLPGLRVLSWTYCWRARKLHEVQQTV